MTETVFEFMECGVVEIEICASFTRFQTIIWFSTKSASLNTLTFCNSFLVFIIDVVDEIRLANWKLVLLYLYMRTHFWCDLGVFWIWFYIRIIAIMLAAPLFFLINYGTALIRKFLEYRHLCTLAPGISILTYSGNTPGKMSDHNEIWSETFKFGRTFFSSSRHPLSTLRSILKYWYFMANTMCTV